MQEIKIGDLVYALRLTQDRIFKYSNLGMIIEISEEGYYRIFWFIDNAAFGYGINDTKRLKSNFDQIK